VVSGSSVAFRVIENVPSSAVVATDGAAVAKTPVSASMIVVVSENWT
jgi:hypothetical protein